MDASTITAIAGGIAVVLKAIAVLVTALRARQVRRAETSEPAQV